MDALLRRHYMMTRLRPASQQVISYRASTSGTGAASIAKIKGRTDAWNQLCAGVDRRFSGTFTSSSAAVTGYNMAIVSGHKYAVLFSDTKVKKARFRDVSAGLNPSESNVVNGAVILTYNVTTDGSTFLQFNGTLDDTYDTNIFIYDLTLQYGAGREPATAAAFLAEYPEALTAPYNAGKLINNKMTALVTDGFNQWDEVWELGTINTTTGAKEASNYKIRSANYIAVFPGTVYGVTNGGDDRMTIAFYDINKNFISSYTAFNTFTTPANAYYILFTCRTNYGTTYRNDIAINLSHSGIRNGEYEPYWESERALNIPTMMGKKIVNGSTEGQESVNIFADMVGDTPVVGMKGIDSVYDFGQVEVDGYIRKVTKKIAAFGVTSDLSLDSIVLTSLASSNAVFIGLPLEGKIRGRNLSNKYNEDTTATQSSTQADKTIRLTENSACCIRDTSILASGMTKEQVRTALLGVTFIYELETPEEYLLDTPIASNYRVDDFGTEQRLPDGIVDGAPASTPLVADIRYPW